MSESAHIINKIVIDLDIGTEHQSKKDVLSSRVKSEVLSAVDNLLQTFDDDGVYLRFKHLSLDLDVDANDLDRLGGVIEQALSETLSATAPLKTNEHSSDEQPVNITAEKRREEVFHYFMKNGQFPWWSRNAFSLDDLEEWLIELPKNKLKEHISAVLKHYPKINRLTQQFSEKTNQSLLKTLYYSKLSYDKIMSVSGDFIAFLEQNRSQLLIDNIHRIKMLVYAEAWKVLHSTNRNPNQIQKDFVHAVVRQLALHINPHYSLVDEWNTWVNNNKKDDNVAKQLLLPSKLSLANNKKETKEVIKSADDETGYHVPQSGLILLNPFIPRLCKNLGLIQNGSFLSIEKRERAVCLLHYLATGEDTFPEPDLVLPKLLCGWPINSPVSRFLTLDKEEKSECNALLESTIEHWSALKNTSPAGLTTSFLKRTGRMRRESFGWMLYVESRTEDILLNRLPWAISVVKYDWMDSQLTVKWE